jgi:hypothetical protein
MSCTSFSISYNFLKLPLESSNHSVLRDICTDNHPTTLANDKRFGLIDRDKVAPRASRQTLFCGLRIRRLAYEKANAHSYSVLPLEEVF